MSEGLSRARTADLKKLHAGLRRGTVQAPLTPARLSAGGVGRLSEHMPLFEGLSAEQLQAWLGGLLAERESHRGARLELVWTGPDLPQTVVRDTARVVRDLFERAQKTVLVGGCYFTKGEAILKPLYKAIRDRGVEAIFCLNIEGEAPSPQGVAAYVGQQVGRFIESNWKFGAPYPRFFYDPRTAAPGGTLLKLHSKCVVVDEQHSFITSANFTFLGQRQNIETGVQIDDAEFAKELSSHWRALIEAGLLHEHVLDPAHLKLGKMDVRCEEWDSWRPHVPPEYWPLFDALKVLGLVAPDDIEGLAFEGRTTGVNAICSWENGSQPFALVPRGSRVDNLAPIEVGVDDDPSEVAKKIAQHLESAK